MPREIKFRAWDKELKKFYEPTYRGYEGNIFEIMLGMQGHILARDSSREGSTKQVYYLKEYYERFEIMQFTGLKDKNLVEIYEGDIIEGFLDRIGIEGVDIEKGKVIYKDGCYKVYTEIGQEFVLHNITDTIVIIGNIYNNPNLLKNV